MLAQTVIGVLALVVSVLLWTFCIFEQINNMFFLRMFCLHDDADTGIGRIFNARLSPTGLHQRPIALFDMWEFECFRLGSYSVSSVPSFNQTKCLEIENILTNFAFQFDYYRDHCKECCHKDSTATTLKKYPKAVLEVCTCKFGAYPQIQAFIKSDRPAKFPNLTIKYLRGLDPIVKLLDANGNVKETLSITKWNTDTVEEFFATHLEKVEDKDYLKTNRIWSVTVCAFLMAVP